MAEIRLEYAVPAMSRCTHGYSSANSFRNMAVIISSTTVVFFMSATSDLISSCTHPVEAANRAPAARFAAVSTSSISA